MKTIKRVYPIRKTANYWRIPIIVTHVCSERCSFNYVIENFENNLWFKPVKNPQYKDQKCPLYGKKTRSFGVHLKDFDINNPTASFGEPIFNTEEIVIEDKRFDVIISYPLRDPIKISMIAPSEKGFSRKELIYSLKHIYDFIYREEERTSSPTIYEYQEDCKDCKDKTVNTFFKECQLRENCAICYTLGKKSGCTLPCGHNFHYKCALKWIEENNTCPLCRDYVKKCETCKGLGFVIYTRENVVIPVEERGIFHNRNSTDGVFGIWGHDFEDLFLDKLFYDNKNKMLRIQINT